MISTFSGHRCSATFFIFCIAISGAASANPSASDAQASVPAVTYRNVFRETSLGVELGKVDWRKANDDVGKFTRGHVDILKQEEMDGKAAGSATLTSTPSNRAPAPHRH